MVISATEKVQDIAGRTAPEIWGGAEYTLNRVGDRYFDQTAFSGHDDRLSDYEQVAAHGIRTLRVGLLWERFAAQGWSGFDRHLGCIRELGIRPIAGLLHHGSGPPHTSLLDPEFPEQLAAYAGQVAERFPWIDAYTPVNEPNTTARFSCMYGLWYPHHRSRGSYLHGLLNQLRATVLSMEAIRRVRPDAQLIQTDDVGRICGTEPLRSTWEMLNQRQWLPFDLLCGTVAPGHPMFEYMRREGISEREIDWFALHPCPPQVIGINYYATSDRYFDHRVDRYPSERHSSEGPFADVEAVRVHRPGLSGIDKLLLEAWSRYGLPLAVTEVHLGGPVQEQIRWLAEVWSGVLHARRQGADCIALTIWALMGSFFWNELVTCENGHYEPGLFDVRSHGVPRPTELAAVVQQLTRGHSPRHPALETPGWWRRDDRVCFPCAAEPDGVAA